MPTTIDRMKAKPVAKQGRKATGLMKTAGLPFNWAMRLFTFEAYGLGIGAWDDHLRAMTFHTA